jgi:hypothetical protein
MPTKAKKTVSELELKSMARGYTEISIKRLAGYVMPDEGVEDDIRLRAIGMLLDRGWGKPSQESTHEVKGEIKVILRKMLEDEDDG